MEPSVKVIGIAGHPGSGKDTAGDYLISKGYVKFSGGDVLREKMRELGLSTEKRTDIHEFVKEQRKKHGNAFPAPEIADKITGRTVIVGFRNVEEVAVFKERFGNDFTLIAIETPLQIRYERAKERNRTGDDISLERFKEEELRERAADSGSHAVDDVLAMADVTVANDGSKEELFKALDALL